MDAPCYEGKSEVAYAAKNALNILSGRHVIGQPETLHSCLNLPLTLCSDNLVEVRISGWTRLQQKNPKYLQRTNDIFTKYYLRSDCINLSLWKYFHLMHK